jgi:hypothetical protein
MMAPRPSVAAEVSRFSLFFVALTLVVTASAVVWRPASLLDDWRPFLAMSFGFVAAYVQVAGYGWRRCLAYSLTAAALLAGTSIGIGIVNLIER